MTVLDAKYDTYKMSSYITAFPTNMSSIKMSPNQGKRRKPNEAGATTTIGLPKKRLKNSNESKKVAFGQKSSTEKCTSEYNFRDNLMKYL